MIVNFVNLVYNIYDCELLEVHCVSECYMAMSMAY